MIEHSVVVAVAAYASTAAAEHDFNAVRRARDSGALRHVAAAVLRKGPSGALGIQRCDGTAANVTLGDVLLGAALVVLVAPVGISYVQLVATTPAGWARVGALVDHFWQNIPQEELHQMNYLVESSPAGLIIVAVDQTAGEIGRLLSVATATIVTRTTATELSADITDPKAAG